MILSPSSHSRSRAFLYRASLAIVPCNSAFTQSPVRRCFAWQAIDGHDAHTMRFTHRLLWLRGLKPASGAAVPALRFGRHPYMEALRGAVFIHRQFSRIVPAFPRSLARCFSRAPSQSDSAARRVLLFPDSSPNQVRWVPTPQNAPSALGAGPLRVASLEECPEGTPGKSKQEN
jgi:hypothetical protein